MAAKAAGRTTAPRNMVPGLLLFLQSDRGWMGLGRRPSESQWHCGAKEHAALDPD